MGRRRWDISLDRVFGHTDPEFEEFAVDALGAPSVVFFGPLLNQGNKFHRQARAATASVRLESPEEFESLTVPTEQSVGSKDEECLSPIAEAAGKDEDPEAI
jgi:hypothetical protein